MALLDERLTINEDRVRRIDEKLDVLTAPPPTSPQQQHMQQQQYGSTVKSPPPSGGRPGTADATGEQMGY